MMGEAVSGPQIPPKTAAFEWLYVLGHCRGEVGFHEIPSLVGVPFELQTRQADKPLRTSLQ